LAVGTPTGERWGSRWCRSSIWVGGEAVQIVNLGWRWGGADRPPFYTLPHIPNFFQAASLRSG